MDFISRILSNIFCTGLHLECIKASIIFDMQGNLAKITDIYIKSGVKETLYQKNKNVTIFKDLLAKSRSPKVVSMICVLYLKSIQTI